MNGPILSDLQVGAELKNLWQEFSTLNKNLLEFTDDVCSEKYGKNSVIVEGAVTNIGTSVNFRVPKMYQVGSLFGRMKCLAISRRLFSPKDIKAIEAKLRRKLDRFDTIYVKRPAEGGAQSLIVVRLVRLSDVAQNKL